jgi:hypothetical protein
VTGWGGEVEDGHREKCLDGCEHSDTSCINGLVIDMALGRNFCLLLQMSAGERTWLTGQLPSSRTYHVSRLWRSVAPCGCRPARHYLRYLKTLTWVLAGGLRRSHVQRSSALGPFSQ